MDENNFRIEFPSASSKAGYEGFGGKRVAEMIDGVLTIDDVLYEDDPNGGDVVYDLVRALYNEVHRRTAAP